MSTALETVQKIYAAFGRGDVPAILDTLDDDVKWENWEDNSAQRAGVPWLRGGSGKAAVCCLLDELRNIERGKCAKALDPPRGVCKELNPRGWLCGP